MAASERDRRVEELASDILSLARNTILVKLRFMDRAVFGLKPISNMEVTFCTDGRSLYYSPWFLLNVYKTEHNAVTRNMLHTLFHCVFRHNMIGPTIERGLWDLAADIAVENVIDELDRQEGASGGSFHVRRADKQQATLELLREELKSLTAERIYSRLKSHRPAPGELEELRVMFLGDDHSPWYGIRADAEGVDLEVDLQELWEEISKRMQTELELCRDDNGVLVQNLRSVNRTRYDYTEFLRHFGVHGEVMRLSDEEFDMNYYTYGLDMYGDIPLIEPMEYKEQTKVRDFVIAIDTSGSVQGDVVQRFVQHTHDILARQECFFSKINIHIIQCDDRIREDVHIRDHEEFEKYLQTMQIKGLGETDFRPVFEHVERLKDEGAFSDLKGLIYFTDGQGIYPEKRPDYEVAFVIRGDECGDVEVPDWAIRIDMEE